MELSLKFGMYRVTSWFLFHLWKTFLRKCKNHNFSVPECYYLLCNILLDYLPWWHSPFLQQVIKASLYLSRQMDWMSNEKYWSVCMNDKTHDWQRNWEKYLLYLYNQNALKFYIWHGIYSLKEFFILESYVGFFRVDS